MNKKWIIFGGGGCGVLVLLCIAFAAIAAMVGVGATQPLADVGDKFMNALKDGNYSQAFSACAPELQQKLGNAAALKNLIENGKVQPVSWSYNSRQANNAEGLLEGTVTMKNNRQGTLRIELVQKSSDWQVIGFNLKEN